MTIPNTVRRCLDDRGAIYSVHPHPTAMTAAATAEAAHVSGDLVVKAVVLKDAEGFVVALLPASHTLHVVALSEALGRELTLAAEKDFEGVFADCDAGAVPAVAAPYGVVTVLDASLTGIAKLFLESGSHRDLIEMSGEDFQALHADSPKLEISSHKH